ncbi:MAG: hypothetical protein AAB779_03995 [Patescibacteria group bacterium]
MTKKKIFIIGFSTPILKDVVLQLQNDGADIVYWQGYRDYFRSICQDGTNFPGTIFHYAADAIRNIPPVGVDVSAFEPPSRDLIERLSGYESPALFLIERADYTHWPLARKRHVYYEYIKFWQGMIKKLQPDAIIFPDIPHSGNHYVLYILAKALKIKIVITEQIGVESRTLLVNDYEKSSLNLLADYEANRDKKYRIEDLSPDIKDYYLKHADSTLDATPAYQKRALRRQVPFRTPTFKVIIKHILHLSIFRVTFSYLRMLLMKNEEQFLDAPMRGWRYQLIVKKWIKINRALQAEYAAAQVAPDWTKKFIYIPLNVQPERTTCPQAGVFDDQLLLIETVAHCLPKDWVIYVKENPNQLNLGNIFCHMYRYQGYYKNLSRLSNVHLVPADTSTYDLIRQAQAVATGTGTAGWEALMRLKPVLVFGSVWYMYCPGAWRVMDVISCQQAIDKISNGSQPDKQNVLNYLAALDRNSIKARHFRTLYYQEGSYEKSDFINHGDNVKNLSQALSNAILC